MRIMTRLFFASLGLAADACCSYVWSSTTGGATSGTFNVSLSGVAAGDYEFRYYGSGGTPTDGNSLDRLFQSAYI